MREKKVHLKGHTFRYHNACGANTENTVDFEEFEFYTPKEKRCKNCLETNEYKNMLAEHESKRPLEENEFDEPERLQLEIDAKKYNLSNEQVEYLKKNNIVGLGIANIDGCECTNFDGNECIFYGCHSDGIYCNKEDDCEFKGTTKIYTEKQIQKIQESLNEAIEKEDNYANTPEKYKLTIKNRNGESVVCDVYDIIESIGYLNTPHFQGLKKALCPGIRGAKDVDQDLNEAIQCFEIAKLMIKKEEL